MTVNVKSVISAGADLLLYGVRNASGIFIGSTATAPTAGNADGSPAMQLEGVKNAPHSVVEPDSVNVTGDNSVLGQFQFEPAELASFVLEVAVHNLQFEALVQGLLVRDLGDLSVLSIQPEDASYLNMVLMITAEAQSRAAGSVGVSQFETLLIPNATVVPLSRDGFSERSPATYRYRVTCNPVDTFPWGAALADGTDGTTGASAFIITSENRLHMHAFTGDAAATTFNLDYTPAEASGDKVLVWVGGTLQTYTTGYTASVGNKTITFASGSIPASGAAIVVLFEYTLA